MFEIGPLQYFFKNSTKKIYSDDEIVIRENNLVLITGPSGSGKSSLLSMLKGIIPIHSSGELKGKMFYNGESYSEESFKKNLKDIVFLFQNPFSQLIYPLVPEEFFFSMENFGFTLEQMDYQKKELDEKFNLSSFWHKKTTELSHGECQKLVLSSLLAIDPKVLLLDEPTAFLDPSARRDFYILLKKIKGTRTIVVVDHHVEEILPFADQVISLSSQGRISCDVDFLEKEEKFDEQLFYFKDTTTKMIQLKLSEMFFHYTDQKELLKNISLKISAGEIFVLKGKNGTGKSTLFKLIADLLKPTKGKVEIQKDNKIMRKKDRYKEIGFIFQNPETHFFYDTIGEELGTAITRDDVRKMLSLFLKDVDLNRSPFLLSEGEKRRLSILMTVVLNKTILLYDEPTFGQDQKSISIIKEMIRGLKEMGKIQCIISHDEKFIDSISKNVFELVDGNLVRSS